MVVILAILSGFLLGWGLYRLDGWVNESADEVNNDCNCNENDSK